MRVYLAISIIEDKKPYTKQLYLQYNKIIHLEDSMGMYSIYNSEALEKLITTVHKMQNFTMPNEKLFAGTFSSWYTWFLTKDGVFHYAIKSIIFENDQRQIC